jgi:hypothetical protein
MKRENTMSYEMREFLKDGAVIVAFVTFTMTSIIFVLCK